MSNASSPAIFHRSAAVAPASYSEADNTIDVIWTTGAPVNRYDLFGFGSYIETLDVAPASIRMDRLNAGAAFLDSHDQYELGAVLGSVVPGTARIAGGKGLATIRLADTADTADTITKLRAGHLHSVSVGYLVHTYQHLIDEDGGPDELRAIDWEPVEISLVSVPADPGAIVRSDNMTRIVEGGARRRRGAAAPAPQIQNRAGLAPANIDAVDERDETIDEPEAGRRETPARAERSNIRGGNPSRTRLATVSMIRNMCSRTDDLSRGFERQLIEDHADEPMTEHQLVRAINDELMARHAIGTINASSGSYEGRGGYADTSRQSPEDALIECMSDALYARMSGTAPSDRAREFMGARMVDMARGLMEARGERVRWHSASQIVARFGAHTTSDFPIVLGNAARRYLVDIFNNYPSPLKALTKPRTAQDFRSITVAKVGQNPALLMVSEGAEFKRGGIVEAAEGYKLTTYGRIFALSRQALINDDLGAFAQVFNTWGRAGVELEANLIAGIIMSNPAMSDGNPLYSAAHGNLAAEGSAITVASLSAARLAMRQQKDIDGVTPVNAAPKFLVVGAAKETEAEQLLTSLNATVASDANPFPGQLTLLVDPRLTGNAWRLFADPGQWPVIEVARLAGQEDVYVETRSGFDVDGVETKARLDIGAAAIDSRGSYLNPGN